MYLFFEKNSSKISCSVSKTTLEQNEGGFYGEEEGEIFIY